MDEPRPHVGGPDAEPVRAQLQRILAATAFRNAPILSRFLRYLVECHLDDAHAAPKEYSIGVDVFGRGAGFDPRVDTIVRVQARRLRKRLDRYYETEGTRDPLRIRVPTGHYRAEVSTRRTEVDAPHAADTSGASGSDALAARGIFRSRGVPAPRTPLIGRVREVDDLCALFSNPEGPRIVTLTGTGGSGKTRLAIETGLRLQARGWGNVRYVRLGAVRDALTFQLAMLRTLDLRAVDDTPPLEVVCRWLHDATVPVLLILDNFEQLLEVAPLVGAILDAGIQHRVLVTSRIPLRLYGEHEFRVQPLGLPPPSATPLVDLAAVPSIQLFVQRAAAVRAGFMLTDDNASAVARLCRYFDGLPLGIELAAAQCRTSTPAELLRRIPNRLDLPAGNGVDAPERQRTLRSVIEWSCRLLAPAEQRLYARLAIFAGGCTAEAARAVVNTQDDLGVDVDAGLARLRDCGLIDVASAPGELRFAMLDTVREHALERLAAGKDRDITCRAHAACCLALAQDGVGDMTASERHDWLARCDRERDNFGAALDGLLAHGNARWALLLVCALYRYWERREHIAAARHSLDRVLRAFTPDAAPRLWVQAACCAASLEGRAGNQRQAQARLAQALASARAAGDLEAEVMALNGFAIHEHFQQHPRRALVFYRECLQRCEAAGLRDHLAAATSNLAVGELVLGDLGAARSLTERARALFQKQKAWVPATWCINQLGDVAMAAGNCAEARRRYREAAHRFQRLGAYRGVARCWSDLGHLALQERQRAEAAALFGDALQVHVQLELTRGVAGIIEGCAILEAANRHYPRALTMAGAAETVRASRDLIAYPYQRQRLERGLASASKALGRQTAAECLQRGRTMNAHEAIAYVQRCLASAAGQASAQRSLR